MQIRQLKFTIRLLGGKATWCLCRNVGLVFSLNIPDASKVKEGLGLWSESVSDMKQKQDYQLMCISECHSCLAPNWPMFGFKRVKLTTQYELSNDVQGQTGWERLQDYFFVLWILHKSIA